MKIPALRVWIIVLLLLSLSVAAGQPLATAAPAKTDTLDQLVGSWAVEVTVVQQDAVFPALITFTSDGIVLTDEPPSPFETTGHGAWVATGPDSADYTFVALIGSESGALSAKIKLTGSLKMDAAADTWAGPFKIQIVDADGAEILADEGTFAGTRIAVETVAPAALTPGDKIDEMQVVEGPVPFDLNITHYGAYCNANPMLEPDETVARPGAYDVECSVPTLPQMFIGYGATARSAELLDAVWAATTSELYINDQPIDQPAFGAQDVDVPVSGMPGQDPNEVLILKARVWNVILENLTPGEFTMRLFWHIDQELSDGDVTWPAGDYDVNYTITVDPAMPLPEGVPAPVEMVRSPVEYIGKIDTSAQEIQDAVSIAVDEQGNIYVTDSSDTPRVLKYDKDGNFVTEWGSRGSGEGQFEFLPPNPEEGPSAGFVAIDGEGNVLVSDAYNGRIQKFDPEGNFLSQFGSIGPAEDQFDKILGPVYVDSEGNIYVSSFPRVQKFDADGNFLASHGTAGTGEGEFNGAAMSAIDDAGNMYVADLLSARIEKLDVDGNFVLQWGGEAGTEPGQLNMPVIAMLDSSGKLYVADNTDRIQIFDTEGNFLDQWSTTGDGNPPLGGDISGLTIDGQDNIYVLDGATPSVYVFRPR